MRFISFINGTFNAVKRLPIDEADSRTWLRGPLGIDVPPAMKLSKWLNLKREISEKFDIAFHD